MGFPFDSPNFLNAIKGAAMTFKALLNSIAAAAAFVSAVLWFGAAKIRISVWGDLPHRDAPDDQIIVDDVDFVATVAEQAKWNRWAALVAGFAALCQAVALILPT